MKPFVLLLAVCFVLTIYALGCKRDPPPQTTEIPITVEIKPDPMFRLPDVTPDPQPPTPIAEDSANSDVKEAPPACASGGCSSGSCSRKFRPIRGLFRR
jgi:hypothetical protein